MNDFTAVITTYNSAHLVHRAIDSILRQTVPAREIVVVDDGSTDDTETIVRSYGAPVRYLWQPNAGVAAARNRGIDAAKTTWIAFLDADDWWIPEKTERQLALAKQQPQCGLIYSDALVVDERGTILSRYLQGKEASSGWIAENLLGSFFVLPSTMLVRRDLILQAGKFTDYLRMAEDCDFCIRLARLAPFGLLQEPLIHYQRQPNSSSRNKARMAEYEIFLMKKLLASPVPPAHRDKLQARLERRLLDVAYHYRRKFPKAALNASMEALRMNGPGIKGCKILLVAGMHYLLADPDV